MSTPITIAYGDGIGPEIMDATLNILKAAGAQLAIEEIKIGQALYDQGILSGIEDSAWESLRRTKIFLKAPITTPQGKGVKSLNVTVRKTLSLYANVRPCMSYAPFIHTKHPTMDVVIVRENEEGLYGGIEHRQTHDVYQCLRLLTEPGCERIVRYAFEYARQNNRKKVTCFTKDNIMKLTDGLFHKTFDRIAAEYPELENEHWIIDIGTAKLADTPEIFDVIVTANLYGDIISDVAAQLTGSVGLGGSANIGEHCAMFEAIHGSAPSHAGKNTANPSGLLMGAVMMLVHIGQGDVATRVHNAWLKTIEDGIHTQDIYDARVSKQNVSTKEFAQAVIERLGATPSTLTTINYDAAQKPMNLTYTRPTQQPERKLVGIDVFMFTEPGALDELAEKINNRKTDTFELKMITSRGTKVWPERMPETFLGDHWRCRFKPKDDNVTLTSQDLVTLQQHLLDQGIDVIKTENLYFFGDEPGYSMGQGE